MDTKRVKQIEKRYNELLEKITQTDERLLSLENRGRVLESELVKAREALKEIDDINPADALSHLSNTEVEITGNRIQVSAVQEKLQELIKEARQLQLEHKEATVEAAESEIRGLLMEYASLAPAIAEKLQKAQQLRADLLFSYGLGSSPKMYNPSFDLPIVLLQKPFTENKKWNFFYNVNAELPEPTEKKFRRLADVPRLQSMKPAAQKHMLQRAQETLPGGMTLSFSQAPYSPRTGSEVGTYIFK